MELIAAASSTLVLIITIIVIVLNIILFFKIWMMCDDVRALRNKYAPKKDLTDNFKSDKDIEKWLNEDPEEAPKKRKKQETTVES